MNLVKVLFPLIAILFLGLGVMRLMRDGGKWHPQSKTWLLTRSKGPGSIYLSGDISWNSHYVRNR